MHYSDLPIFWFGFLLELLKILSNALTTVKPCLSFKGATHTYLLKRSMADNKYLISLLYALIYCISAKSTPQILSLNKE